MKRFLPLAALALAVALIPGCALVEPQLPEGITLNSEDFPEGMPVFEENILPETVSTNGEITSALFTGDDADILMLRVAFEALGFNRVTEAETFGSDEKHLSASALGYEIVVAPMDGETYQYLVIKD